MSSLHVEIESTDGRRYRWASDSREARNRPQGISFGTQRFDGFKAFSCALPRHITDQDADTLPYGILRVVADDGSIAWEGRVEANPRSVAQTHTQTVNAAGLMANARDQKFSQIFVDRDANHWQDMTLDRKAVLANAGRSLGDLQFSRDRAGAIVNIPAGSTIGNPRTVGELWYLAPTGCKIHKFAYSAAAQGTFTGWTATWRKAENASGTGDTILVSDVTNGDLQVVDVGAYTNAIWYQVDSVGNTLNGGTGAAAGQHRRLNSVAVYGDHNLPLSFPGGAISGVYASDVIRWIINTYCPMLNPGGVRQTTYPIGHLVFLERTHPYDAMLTVNKFHEWGLECWEGGTVHFGPPDYTDWDWELRTTDFGTELDEQGLSAEGVANGIEVTFTDAADGVTKTLLPQDHVELRDLSASNPANRAGIVKTIELSLPLQTQADAIQLGRVALAEAQRPNGPGRAVKRGTIRDRRGIQQPVYKVRAGDRCIISDLPSEQVWLVESTEYTHGDGGSPSSVTINFQGPPSTLGPWVERIIGALAAANL